MSGIERFATVDQLLERWRHKLGRDYDALRNHILRTCILCERMTALDGDDAEKVSIAGVFHDLGIWSHGTWDYLEPSVGLAEAYLQEIGREEWGADVASMVRNHHKITALRDPADRVIEAFRKADWVDVFLGIRAFGFSRREYWALLRAHPSRGFHMKLIGLTIVNTVRRPWRPMPMFRW